MFSPSHAGSTLRDVGRAGRETFAHRQRAKAGLHGAGQRKPVAGQRLGAADRRTRRAVKTARSARASEMSPISVEVAWALT